jgi:uncharacterized membrane protein YfbV (UPF0208 family)
VAQYSKFLAALAGVIALLGQAIYSGGIDASEAGALVTAAITAAGVYKAHNRPGSIGRPRVIRRHPT